jgi:hypothetical protein
VLFAAARSLRLASIAACLITIASFTLFAVNQTSSASAHQQGVLNGEAGVPSPENAVTAQPAGTAQAAGSALTRNSGSSSSHEDEAHRVIDDASNALTSPFSGVTAGSSSQWAIRGVKLLLALAVYGFGLAFAARVVRARV